jgi:Spy/CpxP family protein refolding chaperone
MTHRSPFLIAALLAFAGPAFAQHAGEGAPSPYAGEQGREIATLSGDDLAELARGGGWGLARAAELNGVPGPTHLLELADEIGLDAEQRAAVTTIRDEMRVDAIAAGARLVAAERALDAAFTNAVPDADMLAGLVTEAGEARAALRLVHLAAHLRAAPLLTAEQVARYGVLRGYADDPCEAVPKGHDPAMWKQHNGCG